jgi:hypothetical protein
MLGCATRTQVAGGDDFQLPAPAKRVVLERVAADNFLVAAQERKLVWRQLLAAALLLLNPGGQVPNALQHTTYSTAQPACPRRIRYTNDQPQAMRATVQFASQTARSDTLFLQQVDPLVHESTKPFNQLHGTRVVV